MKNEKIGKTVTQHVHKNAYTYECLAVPDYGKRTIKIVVTDGELKGKSALIIKMPDQFSGFFPEMDPSVHSGATISHVEKVGITNKFIGRKKLRR